MDLCGGWSDTPPICFDRGGLVVSLALNIDGQVITNHFVVIESMCFFHYAGRLNIKCSVLLLTTITFKPD